jgi:hypothetical protein
MADLTITAANVAKVSGTTVNGTAGATITAGQAVVLSGSTYLLADNNHATAALRVPTGIALHAASSGQPLAVLTNGTITIGATMTAGVAYYLSGTAGAICPVADVASGMRAVLIGISTSTTVLSVKIHDSGVTL